MEDLKSQIKYIKGFMDPQEAGLVAEYAKKHSELFSNYGNNEQEFTVHTYHEIQGLDSDLLDMIQETALMVYSFVLNNYNSKFDHFIDEKTHIAKFVEGKGMHEHFDASRPNDIATLIYLNNDYDGGDIYFPKYEISFKPEPGDLLCFPDNPSFVHGVKPIIRGTRFTLPRWFTRIV
jgi:predicted 2-oxoglutarate/Fe(II)-dependent dioxygenase YbiX